MQEESKLQEKVQEFEVTDTYDGNRLDKFLSAIYSGQSRTFFQKLIKAGNVTVNGEIIQKNSFPVAMDDLVTVTIPETESVDILPEDIPLDILYEDDDVLIVNKPKGMVVHPSAGHTSGTLVNAIMFHSEVALSCISSGNSFRFTLIPTPMRT